MLKTNLGNFPELTGPEALVDLASQIRNIYIEELADNPANNEYEEPNWKQQVETHTDANWWIEHIRIPDNPDLYDKYNLPDLKGTHKQVNWACEIRKTALINMFRKLRQDGKYIKEDWERFWTWIKTQTDASWWIEYREELEDSIYFRLIVKLESLPKPVEPEIVKGCWYKWNKEIHGTSGNYFIYVSNKKIRITEEEKVQLEEYISAKKNYEEELTMWRIDFPRGL